MKCNVTDVPLNSFSLAALLWGILLIHFSGAAQFSGRAFLIADVDAYTAQAPMAWQRRGTSRRRRPGTRTGRLTLW